MEYNKTDILWFSEKDWQEGLCYHDSNFGSSFSKVIDFEKDYTTLSKKCIDNIIQNLKDHLKYLMEVAKNSASNLPKFCFEDYNIKSLNQVITYKKIDTQRHIPEVDSLIQKLKKVKDGKKDFYYFQIENTEVEKLGGVCQKILRNLKIETLPNEIIEQLLRNNLICLENNKYQASKKLMILFGR